MLVVLLLVALAVGIAMRGHVASRQMIVPISAGLAGGLVLLWMVGLPGPGMTWTYYALKTNWLVSSCLLWVLFVPTVLWIEGRPTSVPVRDRRGVSAVSMSLVVLLLSGSAASAQTPVLPAARGWFHPSDEVIGQVVEGARAGSPFILWEWSDPGDDRLGNFWAALAWGSSPSGDSLELPGVQGGVGLWAYLETGETRQLCELIMGAPGIVVHTRNGDLESELVDTCPAGEMTVEPEA